MAADEITPPTDIQDNTLTSESAEEFGQSKIGTIEETRYGKLRHYISIVQEMRKNYLDYAMSVIVARALPDVSNNMNQYIAVFYTRYYRSGIHHSSSYKNLLVSLEMCLVSTTHMVMLQCTWRLFV